MKFKRRQRKRRVKLSEVYDRLNQGTMWLDQYGYEKRIEDLEVSHRRNILAWLERNAKSLHSMDVASYQIPGPPNGEIAYEAWEQELNALMRETPIEWVRQTPCFKAIERSLDDALRT